MDSVTKRKHNWLMVYWKASQEVWHRYTAYRC
jgi:hypothetical protein